MRLRPFIRLACLLLGFLSCGTGNAVGQTKPYYAGGTTPFPDEARAVLDRHSDILALGINHDWLQASQIDVVTYAKAIDVAASAVEAGTIPNAVLMADRFQSHTMPAAIGYQMTDPQRWPVRTDTLFYLEDLTGPFVTVPLVVNAINSGKLRQTTTLGDLFPEFLNTDKARITIDMLLRHSSGFPTPPSEPQSQWNNESEVRAYLSGLQLLDEPGSRVARNPINFLLLGMSVEKVEKADFRELANGIFHEYFGGGLTSIGIHPDKRNLVAPGAYGPGSGRLAWAEPRDPLGIQLFPNAGHTGLISHADDLGDACKALMLGAVITISDDKPTSLTLAELTRPDPSIPGGDRMGLGFQVGRFGEKSFGWDSPTGSSIWILPDQFAFIIYLCSADHPEGNPAKGDETREQVLALLGESLLPISSPIDTLFGAVDAAPSSDESAPDGSPRPYP